MGSKNAKNYMAGFSVTAAELESINPDRCQRTTVSGLTTMSACFHPDQNLRARTQKTLSNAASLGLGCLRFSAASCWRRARFSRSRLRRARKSRRIAPKRSPMASIMPEVVSHFACGRQRRILLKSKANRIGANDRIIAMSRHESRQKLAREFGATDIVTERGDKGV